MHPQVIEVAATYLSLADAATPDLVEGLYLTGSAALDDFRPGESDIDFVAVSRAPATTEQVRALELVHSQLARLHPHPFFDGVYLTWDELARDPSAAAKGPHVRGQTLTPATSGGRNPVLWHTLAHRGVTLRGPFAQDLVVAADPAGLAAWTRDNLRNYWRPWWERGSRPTTPAGLALLGTWAPAWGVLGVSRLHHMLATGRVISKSAAAHYARTVFPEPWYRILDECLRIRTAEDTRSLYATPFTRRTEALGYTAMAIDSALAL
ncbi:hypothetical protein GCM10010468_40050 [Actinocorallia longicatena]|uniref:Nucleotidyltransferase-like protein n=1 Tax=Actinocorallia longicatena TaxID=111803 RepID=A0ABP6QCF1_9ACTN